MDDFEPTGVPESEKLWEAPVEEVVNEERLLGERQKLPDTKPRGRGVPTFEQLGERAWEVAKPQLDKWRERLEQMLERKGAAVQKHLHDLSVLYGVDSPDNIAVGLQFYPQPGSHRGEPINNWEKSGRLSTNTADVLYWVSEPSIPAKASAAEIDRFRKNDTLSVLSGILHETQHQSFQGELYQEIIRQAEANPGVQDIIGRLSAMRGSYIEITNELITTYLEQCGRESIENSPDNDQPAATPLKIQVDREKSARVLEAVIQEDVAGWQAQGKGSGPYTDLRQQWASVLGSLPEGYGAIQNKPIISESSSEMAFTGRAIYDIARKLSSSLAHEYVSAGKQMDVEFVKRLYSLVESEMQNPQRKT